MRELIQVYLSIEGKNEVQGKRYKIQGQLGAEKVGIIKQEVFIRPSGITSKPSKADMGRKRWFRTITRPSVKECL